MRIPSVSRSVPTLFAVLGGVCFVVVWAAFSAFVLEPYVLPAPWSVAARMWELIISGTVFANFLSSLWKTLLGWVVAFLLGVPIGFLMGRFRYARAFFHDMVYLAANIPLLVYAIIAIILFGISGVGPAFVVVFLVLPAVALNVAAGVESVDRDLLAMSRSFKRPRWQVVRNVVIPSVVPFAFAGARVSFADSWKLEALTETFGGSVGVGYQIEKAFQVFSVRDLLAWMFFFVLFVVFLERVVLARIERRVFAWRTPTHQGADPAALREAAPRDAMDTAAELDVTVSQPSGGGE